MQGGFLDEKGLDAFSTIRTENFDKHAPKKIDICNLSISLSLIMKFLRQSWRESGLKFEIWNQKLFFTAQKWWKSKPLFQTTK